MVEKPVEFSLPSVTRYSGGVFDLAVRSDIGTLNLRGAGPALNEAIIQTLGAALPTIPNTARRVDQFELIWLGPDEWLLHTPHDQTNAIEEALSKAFDGCHHALTNVSDQWLLFHLSGPRSRGVLACGCPLDLHENAFPPGTCAQSHFLKAPVILAWPDDEPRYNILVARSLAEYCWSALLDSAATLDP
jgi:sarcosine oxidase, subunit gamma